MCEESWFIGISDWWPEELISLYVAGISSSKRYLFVVTDISELNVIYTIWYITKRMWFSVRIQSQFAACWDKEEKLITKWEHQPMLPYSLFLIWQNCCTRAHDTNYSKWAEVFQATNEREDDGAGILHQVAQFSINQVYFIYIQGAHASLHPCKTQRDKVLAAEQVGLYIPLVEACGWWIITKGWAGTTYEKLSVIKTMFPCPQNATHQLSDIQVPN